MTAGLLVSVAAHVGPAIEPRLAPRLSYPEALAEGDIVFRTGTDALAHLVLGYSERARFSHVGALVRGDEGWLVIHSTPAEPGSADGVHAESIEAFASSTTTSLLGVYGIDEMTTPQRRKMREYLLSQIGKPFDYRFQYSDDAAHYCTELVLKALDHAGITVEPEMDRVNVLTLTEAAIPPDSLARWRRLREIAPNQPIQRTAFGSR